MNVDGLCLGVSLGMSTTAEDVETKEQLNRLRAEGCTEIQGYYVCRPSPARESSFSSRTPAKPQVQLETTTKCWLVCVSVCGRCCSCSGPLLALLGPSEATERRSALWGRADVHGAVMLRPSLTQLGHPMCSAPRWCAFFTQQS